MQETPFKVSVYSAYPLRLSVILLGDSLPAAKIILHYFGKNLTNTGEYHDCNCYPNKIFRKNKQVQNFCSLHKLQFEIGQIFFVQ